MSISLAPQIEALIRAKVESGQYASANEVLLEALQLLEDRDYVRQRRIEELRREIRKGAEDLERGDYTEIRDEEQLREFFEGIKRKGRERLESRDKKTA